MRSRAAIFLTLSVLGLGAASYGAGAALTRRIEAETVAGLDRMLTAAGLHWATVTADGLEVTLGGDAPDAAARTAAREVAGRLVSAWRLRDATSLRPPAPDPDIAFRVEILRDEARVTLAGILPDDGSRARLDAAIGTIGETAGGVDLDDSTQVMHAAPGAEWARSLDLAITALTGLGKAQIGLARCAVTISGVAASPEAAARLTQALRAAGGNCLSGLDIIAPRPLVSPYVFSLAAARTGGGDTDPPAPMHLEACTAQSREEARAIEQRLVALGVTGSSGEAPGPGAPAGAPHCTEGLGAPSADWGAAVMSGLDAVAALGGGVLSFVDTDVVLDAPPEVDPDLFDAEVTKLRDALPAMFSLEAQIGTDDGEEEGALSLATLPPAEFRAKRDADGRVALSGPMPNEAGKLALYTFAVSLFGSEQVEDRMIVEPTLPDGWSGRVMAGLKALALLENGILVVEEADLSLAGRTLDPDGRAEARALLTPVTGADRTLRLTVSYDAEAAARASLPAPDTCLDEMRAALAAQQIIFAPASTQIDPESLPVVEALAATLKGCAPAVFEVGAYTDTSGSDELNLRLSRDRAQAVLEALVARGVPLDRLRAKGYGEADPIADNATEAGRALNRRIGLRILEEPDGRN
ncbi:OmpA family protein (plasmid) [Paroceanicella profunda]|uniref:OmpA family protein n=1 Tax=Paroceanicella profunda TaxID=2579971 RepID=A0A5B8FIU0_9RHOB|nr:OmpA family protein [Paroceanicella profunda]QDL94181.1 OmpA family protein [Paroceanicella profunda]